MIVTLGGNLSAPVCALGHLPLTRGGLGFAVPKAPLVKGSWREAPERLNPPGRNLSVTLRVTPPLDKGRLLLLL